MFSKFKQKTERKLNLCSLEDWGNYGIGYIPLCLNRICLVVRGGLSAIFFACFAETHICRALPHCAISFVSALATVCSLYVLKSENEYISLKRLREAIRILAVRWETQLLHSTESFQEKKKNVSKWIWQVWGGCQKSVNIFVGNLSHATVSRRSWHFVMCFSSTFDKLWQCWRYVIMCLQEHRWEVKWTDSEHENIRWSCDQKQLIGIVSLCCQKGSYIPT
jgi:hypothetical protein